MNDDTIRMARESKLDIYGLGCPHDQFIEKVKAFEALVRADERAAILPLLKGIDQTECESADGWWETSTGAAFGAGILAAIEARGNT